MEVFIKSIRTDENETKSAKVTALKIVSWSVHVANRPALIGCVLVYRYTKKGNINELRHKSMYGYENNRNSLVYRYTRTAPVNPTFMG